MIAFALLAVLAAAPAPSEPASITVTAKLVEIPSAFPPDDLYDYAYVMRYEVGRLPVGRIGVFGLWWWMGWHFLAR